MRYMMLIVAYLLIFHSTSISAELVLTQKNQQLAVRISDVSAPDYTVLQSFIQSHPELGFEDQRLSSFEQCNGAIPLVIMNEAQSQSPDNAFKLISAFNKHGHFRWHSPHFWTYLLSGYLVSKFKKETLKKEVNLTDYHLIYRFHDNPKIYPVEAESPCDTHIANELSPLFRVMKNICIRGGRFLLTTLDLTQGTATYLIKMPKRAAHWELLILNNTLPPIKSSTEIKALNAESLSSEPQLIRYPKRLTGG